VVDCTAGRDPSHNGNLLNLDRSTLDELGRDSDLHPVEKLKRVGGTVGHARRIEAVYKIGYMTNEQAARRDGVAIRVNDIMAYPLYICIH